MALRGLHWQVFPTKPFTLNLFITSVSYQDHYIMMREIWSRSDRIHRDSGILPVDDDSQNMWRFAARCVVTGELICGWTALAVHTQPTCSPLW
jgi:hypothetical protein